MASYDEKYGLDKPLNKSQFADTLPDLEQAWADAPWDEETFTRDEAIEAFSEDTPWLAETLVNYRPGHWREEVVWTYHPGVVHRDRRTGLRVRNWVKDTATRIRTYTPSNRDEYAYGPAERSFFIDNRPPEPPLVSPDGVYTFHPDVYVQELDRRRVSQAVAAQHREARLKLLADKILALRFFNKPDDEVEDALIAFLGEWSQVRIGDPARSDERLAAYASQAQAQAAEQSDSRIIDLGARLEAAEREQEQQIKASLTEDEYWVLQVHRSGKVLSLASMAATLKCSKATVHRIEKRLRDRSLIDKGTRRQGVRGNDRKVRTGYNQAAPVTVVRRTPAA